MIGTFAVGHSVVVLGTELLIVLSIVLACALSFVIGINGFQTYQESRDRGIVLLTVGIVLLGGGAILAVGSLRALTEIPHWAVITTGNVIRLLGVIAIILAIYDL